MPSGKQSSVRNAARSLSDGQSGIRDATASSLSDKLTGRTARVAVVGLGYVGLPLAVTTARAGFPVVGLDVDASRADAVARGHSYISDVEDDALRDALGRGLKASSDFGLLADADVVSICVPTPLTETKEPDISQVKQSARIIAAHLKPGQLIVLESTTYPGTTEEVVLPMLEESGLRVGCDFFLAFSPERVDPGNRHHGITNTPRVVGGATSACAEMAVLFLSQFIDVVVPVSSTRAAEMTKLLENIFRCVNIALVNELMLLCDRMGIDIWEVVRAASTKPYGFMPFFPGPGLGGHCIPIDPFYLSWKARQYDFHTEFIELAGKINEQVPYYVVSKVGDALNGRRMSINGSKILVVGVAYKKDVGDTRESPALRVIELLGDKGAVVAYHDPHVDSVQVSGRVYRSRPLSLEEIASHDCAVIITDHSRLDYASLAKNAPVVVDTRNVLAGFAGDNIVRI